MIHLCDSLNTLIKVIRINMLSSAFYFENTNGNKNSKVAHYSVSQMVLLDLWTVREADKIGLIYTTPAEMFS